MRLGGQPGTAEIRGLDGVRRLYGFTDVPSSGDRIFVAIGIPTSVAFAEVGQGLARNLIAIGVALLLVCTAAWAAGEFFVLRRVRALVGATSRLAEGDLAARTGVPYRLGEIGAVAKAVDEMADRLQEREMEARRAQHQLKVSEERYRELFENANDVVYIQDLDGRLVSVNRAAERITGYSPEEMIGRSIADLVAPEHRELALHMTKRSLERDGSASYQLDVIHSDGRRVPLEVSTRVILDGDRPVATQSTARDVTERKRADENLRRSIDALRRLDQDRRRLLSHLSQVQEKERSRIAADIHDDSIQVMTAIGIRLGALRRSIGDGSQDEILDQIEESVSLAIARLRALLFELRPPVLDREGLAPALRMYLQQVGTDGGIEVELENALAREPPSETRAILYRIAREALANVRKHAEASTVTVRLEEQNGGFLVRVRDDGLGLPLSALRLGSDPGHFGLDEMRERAELAGGWWNARNDPRGGTIVEFWVPEEMQGDFPAA
jgi:PAS domain S-box-containing protein